MTAKMVVPVDGSKHAEFAIPAALGVARGIGASIELVSVAEDGGRSRELDTYQRRM